MNHSATTTGDGQVSLFDADAFEPTLAAARARVAALQPAEYARSRNHLEGAVSRLSPYLTHGFLTLREVLQAAVHKQQGLGVQHKFVYELGWREFFQHRWWHRGEGIFDALHEGPLPQHAYATDLPADIREARCGIPVIDAAVRELYATGYLHNHARMWLASYVVHMRRVHWRAGADWMVGHLLDGDLASNHLSWQWVAGTGSHKPYLFNAENVARYAPAAWHSFGSGIDAGYEALERIARGHSPALAAPVLRRSAAQPGLAEPELLAQAPEEFGFHRPSAGELDSLRGKRVRLIHPWSLAEPSTAAAAGTVWLALLPLDFHLRWPWSARRWSFVGRRLAALLPPDAARWCLSSADAAAALASAASVDAVANPHLGASLDRLLARPAPRLFAWPTAECRSFSEFWAKATKGLDGAQALL
jgi:deoxyribodipyrimidine photo-lyase